MHEIQINQIHACRVAGHARYRVTIQSPRQTHRSAFAHPHQTPTHTPLHPRPPSHAARAPTITTASQCSCTASPRYVPAQQSSGGVALRESSCPTHGGERSAVARLSLAPQPNQTRAARTPMRFQAAAMIASAVLTLLAVAVVASVPAAAAQYAYLIGQGTCTEICAKGNTDGILINDGCTMDPLYDLTPESCYATYGSGTLGFDFYGFTQCTNQYNSGCTTNGVAVVRAHIAHRRCQTLDSVLVPPPPRHRLGSRSLVLVLTRNGSLLRRIPGERAVPAVRWCGGRARKAGPAARRADTVYNVVAPWHRSPCVLEGNGRVWYHQVRWTCQARRTRAGC